MFEITGKDIAELGDADLRTLIARLAMAELRANNHPISAVTAGGNQDAPDGGIDVRIELPGLLGKADFLPRASTGFQVKASDMRPSAIRDEMQPGGSLRDSIGDLATKGGAYIIVSSRASVTDTMLESRRRTMRAALDGHPHAAKLATDFYDRERVATWVNEYIGIQTWVRQRSGKPMSGWRHLGDWTDTKVGEEMKFLVGDKACLIDERSKERRKHAITDGIRLLRESLRVPRQCVRLIGMSGVGKTRFVQALFESDVGDSPLDASLALYTDYSAEPTPIAREMARSLVDSGQRAILVVDNCNPATHSELARICSTSSSNISLITVEYDVREDELERTEVFRLESASPTLVAEWISQVFPHISQVDRERIAEFSDGNFRMARALAETLQKGETLGHLKNTELFLRIFEQRNAPSKHLENAAGVLSLLYSFDGIDTSDTSELAVLARIHGGTAKALFADVAELSFRGVVQARGQWRAILPQAIANRLASLALTRIPSLDFDRLCLELPPRMLKSLTRRLGYLHDSNEARSTITRWLHHGGLFGDLASLDENVVRLLENVAPVAPEVILGKLKEVFSDGNAPAALQQRFLPRHTWIELIRALAYEPHMFKDAVEILALFASVEPESNNLRSANHQFCELFHLHLSGTQAPPEHRRDAIRKFAGSRDPRLVSCASVALASLLDAGPFSSSSNFDFGARPRDWGWRPKTYGEIWGWYNEGIALALELFDRLPDAGSILAGSFRSLWKVRACRDSLEAAAMKLSSMGPWIEGWLSARSALNYDSKEMSEDERKRLSRLANRLRPTDLLHQARAVILNRQGVYDFSDGESDDEGAETSWERASRLAQEIGKGLATNSPARKQFLEEVFRSEHASRAYEFGRGLAEGATDLASLWNEISDAYKASSPEKRSPVVLAGFLFQAHQTNSEFCALTLDAILVDPQISPHLPFLQARVALDEAAISRLRTAIHQNATPSNSFYAISNGLIEAAPVEPLGVLLSDLSILPGGIEVALDILHMRFYCERQSNAEPSTLLVELGRHLLEGANFSSMKGIRDYALALVIDECLAGDAGRTCAIAICRAVRQSLEGGHIWLNQFTQSLNALFRMQTHAALDQLLLPLPKRPLRGLIRDDLDDSPLESLDAEVLTAWADIEPEIRYPLLGECLSMFKVNPGGDGGSLSTIFLELLELAPDKPAFLGEFWRQLHSGSWSGSLADVLIKRRDLLKSSLEAHSDPSVRKWLFDNIFDLDKWIAEAKAEDRREEESFE